MSGVCFTSLHSKIQICCSPPRSPLFPGSLSDVRTLSSKFKDRRASGIAGTKLFCSNSFPPAPEERDSKTVLESFFLGKAFAEAINERIETTVGEILSTIGMLQAEQLKQLQDFQDEVFERAKKAKEKAAREALEAQGLAKSSVTIIKSTAPNGAAVATNPSTPDASSSNSGPAVATTSSSTSESQSHHPASSSDLVTPGPITPTSDTDKGNSD